MRRILILVCLGNKLFSVLGDLNLVWHKKARVNRGPLRYRPEVVKFKEYEWDEP